MKNPFGHFESRDRSWSSGAAAFTMIEIAISLAIIGFALVAIIGILPAGMSVQRENREETIINQDATFLMNAIRNGERGVNELTNFVIGITNYWTRYDGQRGTIQSSGRYWYSPTDSSTTPKFPLTNGFRIVGLLSKPRIVLIPQSAQPGQTQPVPDILSNYVVGVFRALSGPAAEKFPQNNSEVKDLSLGYRFIPAITTATDFGTNTFMWAWTNFNDPAITATPPNLEEIARRSNYFRIMAQSQENLRELRFTFRWPLLADGGVGNGRQVFRTTLTGPLTPVIEPWFLPAAGQLWPPELTLYFFDSHNYVKVNVP